MTNWKDTSTITSARETLSLSFLYVQVIAAPKSWQSEPHGLSPKASAIFVCSLHSKTSEGTPQGRYALFPMTILSIPSCRDRHFLKPGRFKSKPVSVADRLVRYY